MKKITTLLFGFLFVLCAAQAPFDYYVGTDGLAGAALKSQLSQIISAGALDKGYDALYNAYPTTDKDHYYDNDGTVLDMYSENPTGPDPYNYEQGKKKCGNYTVEGDCYNREHIIPQSFFNSSAPMVSDLHHIRPTDGKVNGMRSNYPFGKVANASFISKNGSKLGSSASAGYGGTVFEPIDEFKGDIARMVFYFVTRYEDRLSSFSTGNLLGDSAYPGLQAWELQVLRSWAGNDPVSPTELERNEASFAIQKNRNPFIDHPEWVEQIWGALSADNEAPTAPADLSVIATTVVSASLSWKVSTDNTAVTYYKVYKNGEFSVNASTNNVTVTGLKQGTTYSFYVVAVDAANNNSVPSNIATATTLVDLEAPSAPANLTLDSVGTNNIVVQWSAATDNVGIAAYEIYVNGLLTGSTLDLKANIANLNPSTTYSIYIIAKDAAGNSSTKSNVVTVTTEVLGTFCGNENFEKIPVNATNYATYTWTNNGISWKSVDSRTDQTINGRAITIRNGSLTALSAPNGIGDLTVTTQRKFSGDNGIFKIFINDIDTGKSFPYSTTVTTTTVTGLNVSGSVKLTLSNTSSTDRVALDDLSWTCYNSLSTNEIYHTNEKLTIFPNPVSNQLLIMRGPHLTQIRSLLIFDLGGKLIMSKVDPFKFRDRLDLPILPKGMYVLKADGQVLKFIVN